MVITDTTAAAIMLAAFQSLDLQADTGSRILADDRLDTWTTLAAGRAGIPEDLIPTVAVQLRDVAARMAAHSMAPGDVDTTWARAMGPVLERVARRDLP